MSIIAQCALEQAELFSDHASKNREVEEEMRFKAPLTWTGRPMSKCWMTGTVRSAKAPSTQDDGLWSEFRVS